MFTRKTKIGNRLDYYGPSTCPACGNSRETVFAGHRLVCRQHSGHPLYERGAHEVDPLREWGPTEERLAALGRN